MFGLLQIQQHQDFALAAGRDSSNTEFRSAMMELRIPIVSSRYPFQKNDDMCSLIDWAPTL